MPNRMSYSFRKQGLAVLLLCLLFPVGCSLAPTYYRPDAPIPNTYPAAGTLRQPISPNLDAGGKVLTPPNAQVAGQTSTASFAGAKPSETTEEELRGDMLPWKTFFVDPGMQRLIETALVSNRDLRVALLNIEAARAQYRIRQADLLPTVAAGAESANQRIPRDVSATGSAYVSRQYSASLGFNAFELDLFGRIRNLTDAAIETFYSIEHDARTAQLSLAAEVAGMYLQLVADRELYDITQRTYESRRSQYTLIVSKFKAGLASDLEVQQAKGVMEEARSHAARYATRVGQDENYLVLLMGAGFPADLPEVRKLKDVKTLQDVPEGLPSALLIRRPDILAAEHRLKAANANIGAARADFFPAVSLTGALGTLSTEHTNLFEGRSGTWAFLPGVSLPLFDTGRNIARLQVSKREFEIAVAHYEKAIQTAFREVGDALVQRANITEQLDADTSLVNAARRGYDLARQRYDVGVDSYLNVLDAERTLYSAQQSWVGTRLLRESNALTLYKALGGGWQ